MENYILNLSKKLIAIPSVTGELNACNDVLEAAKEELTGFMFEEFEKDGVKSLLFFNAEKRPEKFKVILNGHLDVVPAKVQQFTPRQDGDKLYGRGAFDMKSSTAVLILVYKELAKKLPYNIGLQLVTDEETGGTRGALHQLEQGVTTDFILTGEATALNISNKAKGPMWLTISTTGVTGHGAYLWKSDNALKRLLDAINKLYNEFPIPDKEVWHTTMNLAKIETTNEVSNKVPDNAKAYIDIRYVPDDKRFAISKEKATESLARITGLDPSAIDIFSYGSCHNTNENDPYLLKLKAAAESVTGRAIHFQNEHGGSDIRFYSAHNTPACWFGPAGMGMHSDEEWVSVKSLDQLYEILQTFLKTLDPGSSPG